MRGIGDRFNLVERFLLKRRESGNPGMGVPENRETANLGIREPIEGSGDLGSGNNGTRKSVNREAGKLGNVTFFYITHIFLNTFSQICYFLCTMCD